MTHHKTWFPVIVIALTALLAVFIYSVFRERIANSIKPTPVTVESYQVAVSQEVSTLLPDLEATESVDDRVARLTKSREILLQLRVPASQKDLHLEMVMILTAWIAGEQGEQEELESARSRWEILQSQNSFFSSEL